MSEPISVGDIDLSPIAGKTYFSIDREWREEFIYFLMVDRFQDDVVRPIVAGSERSPGIGTPNTFYGGTIKGVTKNLDYIAGLGCTAISAAARSDRIIVDATLHPDLSRMTFLYGKPEQVQTAPAGARFVQLDLAPHQFVVLA